MANININNANPQGEVRNIKTAKTSRDDVSIHSQQVVMSVYSDVVDRNEKLMKTVDLLQLELRRLEKEYAKCHTEISMIKKLSEASKTADINKLKEEHAERIALVKSNANIFNGFVKLTVQLTVSGIVWHIANQIMQGRIN